MTSTHKQGRKKLVSKVLHIREYQPDAYNKIVKRGHKEDFGQAQDDYIEMAQWQKEAAFEEGKKQGMEEVKEFAYEEVYDEGFTDRWEKALQDKLAFGKQHSEGFRED
jgi:hypothetical protein